MSKSDSTFSPPSLSHHFEAPDDFVGWFGWLCGYSADAGFLDDAVERFVRKTHAQRAYEGRIALALMLHPGHSQITPKEVPGVLHLPINGVQPFKLLHAKVAVLGFRHVTDERQWRLRLLVSTGNWTRETLQDSLDLAWCADLSHEDLKESGNVISQVCADVTAAWSMLDWLRGHFDTRALIVTPRNQSESVSHVASQQVETWIRKVKKVGKRFVPRFVDNRDASFLAKLPDLVRQHGASARNYIAMGSGFYEKVADRDSIPSVLKTIVDSLKDANLLTNQPVIDVFVNPKACQAVANSAPAIDEAGWRVREARSPAYFKAALRSLHAKFIFIASYRENSNLCNGAWLYLGSGNLTGPGFSNRMTLQGGNLEAGVMFAPESLKWFPAKNEPARDVVTNVLPIQWDQDFDEIPDALVAGGDMPESDSRYSAAPVAYLYWVDEGHGGWLQVGDESPGSFDVLDGNGEACFRDHVKGFSWFGKRPREVRVRWRDEDQNRQAWVAVVDEFGRIAATTLPRLDIEEAWGQLAIFPMPPDDEELLPDGDDESPMGANEQGDAGTTNTNYPVRQMMQLVENIAAKQLVVNRADWVAWCTRLEQCLIQAAESPVLDEFLKLELNPLSPLWHAPFRPAFALSSETNEGRRFEESLKMVEAAWNVAALNNIGDPA
ncbi:MAG: hypothetical protein KDA90_17490 [Planctomycetaceae bacterium]|nr:hypothetical protein [Planctomycetaceae bacterium]